MPFSLIWFLSGIIILIDDYLRYKLFKEDKSIRAILDYYPIVTNSFNAINPDDIKEDVVNLYDNLIDNIDDIIKYYD